MKWSTLAYTFALIHFFLLLVWPEKLLTSEGRELRRALFSLKQIFQDDKDLVHGFVALGGLNSLVRVGNDADQNYQNYILRALGQVSAQQFPNDDQMGSRDETQTLFID